MIPCQRWLLEVGRDGDALETVKKLHDNDVTAKQEYQEMYQAIKAEVSIKSRKLSDLWATRAMAHRTFVAVGVQVFCQLTGINGKHNHSIHIPSPPSA